MAESLKGKSSVEPRPRKCLAGVTILLVEDSASTSEALRLMAIASGARLRRAGTLCAAARHLSLYRPNVLIVDMGLPDGNGLNLITETARRSRSSPGIVAISGADPSLWAKPAYASGAGTILIKPVDGIRAFQDAILAVLPDAATTIPAFMPRDTCTDAPRFAVSARSGNPVQSLLAK